MIKSPPKVAPFREVKKHYQLVGAKYEDDGTYAGPIARIEFDKTWLHIVTDAYEGAAMMRIETIPLLIEALQSIMETIK